MKTEQNYEIEDLIDILFDEKRLVRPERELYRLQIDGDRVYYYFDDKGEPVFKQSVTTAIRNNTPTSPFLLKWYADLGWEEANRYRDERAAFGTFLHIQIEQFLVHRFIDLDEVDRALESYAEIERLAPGFAKKHSREAKKGILAFVAFYQDYEVDPLAVEISLPSELYNLAGMLDLVGEISIEETGYWGEVYKSGEKKGKPKETKKKNRIRAIVDFKSGKNFYDDHAHQLEIYRRIWNENFPDYQIERIFNWSPKDWTGYSPSFNLKEQTTNPVLEKLDNILAMNEIDQSKKNASATIYEGQLYPGTDLSTVVKVIDYRDIVKARKEKKESNDKAPSDEI